MSTDENEIARQIVDAAYRVHVTLGPGLLESVYEAILTYELERRGILVERQVPIAIQYDGHAFGVGFRADLVVGGLVIVGIKSTETTAPVHNKQLLTYLRLSDLKLGLLINFGAPLLKDGVTRIVNRLPD